MFDGKGADGEVDGGALTQQKEGFEEAEGVFAAGKADGDAIALANHLEAGHGLADLV